MLKHSSSTLSDAKQEERQSLRSFLASLDPDNIVTFYVNRKDYLLSALVEVLEHAGNYPIVRLVDPETHFETIANVFANRENLKKSIHHILDVEEYADTFAGLQTMNNAPAQQIILREKELDIEQLPVFRHFTCDAGRYITSGIVMARDPESGRTNFSFHRMQIKSPNRLGISLHSRGDLWKYFAVNEAKGKDTEVAVVIGCHPAYYLVGASKIPPTQDDYSWVYVYMDEVPIVTHAKSVDIMVPAYAEYILEGRILAHEREDEGPFAEFTGYSTSRSTRNVLQVDCITKRNDAIYQDLVPGSSWEHLLLSQFTKEIILLHKLQKEIPEVRALCMPKNGSHFHAYLSMKPKAEGQAKQAMMLLFGLDEYLKLIITVDEDINVYNEQEVLWAVATRVQADRDVFIVPDILANQLDPSSRGGVSAKMGIDATCPPGWEAQKITLPAALLEEAAGMVLNTVQ